MPPRARAARFDSRARGVDAAGVRLVVAAAFAVAVALASGPASARRPTKAELAAEGLTDPRGRPAPPVHRLRLSLLSDASKASAALGRDGKITKFYYATLMLDVAYQAQIFRYMMVRPSFAIGGNVANSRNAMPAAIQPGLFAGYQGALLGIAAGYSFMIAFPGPYIGVNNNHGGATQPVLDKMHLFQGEVSLTTRVDRGALNFAVRFGGMQSHLIHLDIDKKRWFGVVTLSAGWFFDLSARRRRRAPAPVP